MYMKIDKNAENPYIDWNGNNCNLAENGELFQTKEAAKEFALNISKNDFTGEIIDDWLYIEEN